MQRFTLIHDQARSNAHAGIDAAPGGSVVTIKDGDVRTLDQNAAMWPRLQDVSDQLDYHGVKLSPEDWKDVFTASLISELRMVPTLDNKRIVILGLRTSKMGKKMMGDLLELITAYGTENGVRWSA